MELLANLDSYNRYLNPIDTDRPYGSHLILNAKASPMPPAVLATDVPPSINVRLQVIHLKAVFSRTPDGSYDMVPDLDDADELSFQCDMVGRPILGELSSFISDRVVPRLHICIDAREELEMEMPSFMARSISAAQRNGFSSLLVTAHTMQAYLPDVNRMPTTEELLVAATDDRAMEAAPSGEIGEVCAVCLDEFLEGFEVYKITKCSHVFHSNCIGRWLQQSWMNERDEFTCPMCRCTIE